MDDLWFNEWVGVYLAAIGHGDRSRAALLAMKHHVVHEQGATLAELGEVCARQVAGGRVPQFAPQVVNALVQELRDLRAERDARPEPDFSAGAPEPPRCPLCGGSGLVAVPHPLCVLRPHDGPPALGHYPGTRMVVTGAVLCDAPDCEPGRDARHREAKRDRPRLALNRYLAALGHVDAAGMLRQFERDQAAACRRRAARGSDQTVEQLLAEVRRRKEAA